MISLCSLCSYLVKFIYHEYTSRPHLDIHCKNYHYSPYLCTFIMKLRQTHLQDKISRKCITTYKSSQLATHTLNNLAKYRLFERTRGFIRLQSAASNGLVHSKSVIQSTQCVPKVIEDHCITHGFKTIYQSLILISCVNFALFFLFL